MIQNYLKWLNEISNIGYFAITNFLLAIFIFLICWIGDQIIDYINLKEDVKELKKEINKIEKRKKK